MIFEVKYILFEFKYENLCWQFKSVLFSFKFLLFSNHCICHFWQIWCSLYFLCFHIWVTIWIEWLSLIFCLVMLDLVGFIFWVTGSSKSLRFRFLQNLGDLRGSITSLNHSDFGCPKYEWFGAFHHSSDRTPQITQVTNRQTLLFFVLQKSAQELLAWRERRNCTCSA